MVLTGWDFDVIISFENEVDYSDFVLALTNFSYAYDDNTLVMVTIGNSILVSHPVTKGAHHGTQLRFSINVDFKI